MFALKLNIEQGKYQNITLKEITAIFAITIKSKMNTISYSPVQITETTEQSYSKLFPNINHSLRKCLL